MNERLEGNLHLELLLDYELRCAKRYRRYVSLIMIAPMENGVPLNEAIGGCSIRECDEYFELDEGSVILLGETDNSGAIVALERFQNSANSSHDLRSSVVSFPFDGYTVYELLSIARRRLQKAKNMQIRGAVITTG